MVEKIQTCFFIFIAINPLLIIAEAEIKKFDGKRWKLEKKCAESDLTRVDW